MPVEGLPNPHLHRLCKRCGKWHHTHEGTVDWPPVTGLISWVQVRTGKLLDRTERMQFRCVACREQQVRSARAWRRSLITAVIMFAVLGVLAWKFGLYQQFHDAIGKQRHVGR